ncbi:hypothetical protein [Oceanidesulfovibrio marinus]|uniref:Uncharacterized protein n=1 Tax=Oceanidesulfovibrio marinus TaxID=370038 RepID=A0A6P1ZCF3_9BACT|nr:hypothetical protein [Oceanidesulfovibrio marinus]TVM31171.1 hypothetical protein DQK91_18855 [Oceanidesulfovibrio marinus]
MEISHPWIDLIFFLAGGALVFAAMYVGYVMGQRTVVRILPGKACDDETKLTAVSPSPSKVSFDDFAGDAWDKDMREE